MPITGARWALESLLEIRSFAQFTPWSIIFRIAIYIYNILYYIYIILYCIVLYYIILHYIMLYYSLWKQ